MGNFGINELIPSMSAQQKIFIYGYGNPGRQDDGLGIIFVERLHKWADNKGLQNISFDSNYQLNAEDAFAISQKDMVIFADASVEPMGSFEFKSLKPAKKISFSTHAMNPESVFALCIELYRKKPAAFLMTIKGYSWDFREGISARAKKNLSAALDFIKLQIDNW